MIHRQFLVQLFLLLFFALSLGQAPRAHAVPVPQLDELSDEPEQGGAASLLRRADAALSSGDYDLAASVLQGGLIQFKEELTASDRFTLYYSLALVSVQLNDVASTIASYIEAIALAEQLGRRGEHGFVGLALSLELELIDFFRGEGRAADAEALAWTALREVLRNEDRSQLPEVVTVLTLAVADQSRDSETLRSFLTELDMELSVWDDYRLKIPPPPEPILGWLEDSAARRIAEGQTSEASQIFEVILEIDRARDADWRLVSDLSAVAFSALLSDDLPSARRALSALDERPLPGGPPVDVLANRCYLASYEGDWQSAEAHCLAGVAAARSAGDEHRALALTSVVAGLRALSGRAPKAVALYEDAAQRYELLDAAQEAAGERARAVIALTEARHLDEALRLLERLDRQREGQPPHPLVEEARQRLAMQVLLSSFEGADVDEVRTTLQSIGGYLFQTGRAVALSEISLLYLDLVLRSEGVPANAPELAEAVTAIVALEEQLGLAPTGWVGLMAEALHHEALGEVDAAIDFAQRAVPAYEDRLLLDALAGDSLRVWMGRGQAPFYRRPLFEPHRLLTRLMASGGDEAGLREITRRQAWLELALLWRQPAAALAVRAQDEAEEQFVAARGRRLQLQQHSISVSLRGGEKTPAEQRAALAPLFEQARLAEDAALAALSPARRMLFIPPRGGAPGSPQKTDRPANVSVLDASMWTCQLGARGGADVFLHRPDERGMLGAPELAELGATGLVILPACEGARGVSETAVASQIAFQEQALALGGARWILRPDRELPKRARLAFVEEFTTSLEQGRTAAEALDRAEERLRSNPFWRRHAKAWRLTLGGLTNPPGRP